MRRTVLLAAALIVGWALAPSPAARATPAVAGPAEWVYAVLPVTPDQAREVMALLRAPGTVAADVLEVGRAVVEVTPSLPGALVHDVVTAPVRDLAILHGIVTDSVDLVTREPGPVFGRTLRALQRSRLITLASALGRRVTAPSNRTARLAIVVAARAQGLPLDTADLDLLRRAIDREGPDVGPLLTRLLERVGQAYGREAVRVLLTP